MELDQQQLEAIFREISGINASEKFSIHLFETLPSTNQKLWQLIEQGAAPGTVVIAAQQTAGRGQWGHQWSSEVGGLYLSLAIAPNLPATQSYQLTLSSAWGIAQALRDRGIPVMLKWPNDLILSNRKLGGILTETKVQTGRITHAVVGVGINWSNAVPDTGINLQSFLADQLSSCITSLEMVAAVTLLGITSGYKLLAQPGIESLLLLYQNLLTNMNQVVSVNGRSGVIVGVTSTGELRVRFGSNQEKNSVNSLEVYLQPGNISLGYG